MGWTLDQVRDLDVSDYNALTDWLNELEQKRDDPDAVDIDKLNEARQRAEQRPDANG